MNFSGQHKHESNVWRYKPEKAKKLEQPDKLQPSHGPGARLQGAV